MLCLCREVSAGGDCPGDKKWSKHGWTSCGDCCKAGNPTSFCGAYCLGDAGKCCKSGPAPGCKSGPAQGCKSGPAPSTCANGWSKFKSAALLAADPWGDYFKLVYGVLPQVKYPFCVADLWMYHDDLLSKAKVTGLPKSVGACPPVGGAAGVRYHTNNMFAPPRTSWSWHPYPWSAFATSAWIEVIHEADPFGDEHYGAWLMYAKGNGIWFNTGRTLAFNEHSDAFSHFKVKSNEALAKAAASAGVDSVQFLAHRDPVEYKTCDRHANAKGWKYLNIEILATKLVGTYACTAAKGAPAPIKAGWKGSKACKCDNSQKFLNCNGLFSAITEPVLV